MQDRLWISSIPERPQQLWPEWCLCQGISLAKSHSLAGQPLTAASLHTAVRSCTNRQPRRGFEGPGFVYQMLRGRLGGHANMTLERVQTIVGATEWGEVDASDLKHSTSFMELVQKRDASHTRRIGSVIGGESGRGGGRGVAQRGAGQTLSPAQLVNFQGACDGVAAGAGAAALGLCFHAALVRAVPEQQPAKLDAQFGFMFGWPNFESEAFYLELIGLVFRAWAGQVPGRT